MLAFLHGKVVEKTPQSLILDVNGVGYFLQIPATTFATLADVGAETVIRTYLYVRESTLALFGFATFAERELFTDLLLVTGIGPKLAMTILSSAPVDHLYRAIAEGREAELTRIHGLGKKTAQRLLIDLKDKAANRLQGSPDWSAQTTRKATTVVDEALSAMLALGYSQAEAQRAVDAALAEFEAEPDVARLIQVALRK